MQRVTLIALFGVLTHCGPGPDLKGPSDSTAAGTQTGTSGGAPDCPIIPCTTVGLYPEDPNDLGTTAGCDALSWAVVDNPAPWSGTWQGTTGSPGCGCRSTVAVTLTPTGPSSAQSPGSLDCPFEARVSVRWNLQTASWTLRGDAVLYYQTTTSAELTILFDDNDLQLARRQVIVEGGVLTVDPASAAIVSTGDGGGSACSWPDCKTYLARVRWNGVVARLGFYRMDEPGRPLNIGELVRPDAM